MLYIMHKKEMILEFIGIVLYAYDVSFLHI